MPVFIDFSYKMLYNVEKKERIKMGLYTKKIYDALGLVEKEKNVFYGVYKGYELTLAVNQHSCSAPSSSASPPSRRWRTG